MASNESKTDITIHAYDKNARRYAQKFMDYEQYKDKILLFQQKHIPGHATILDVGCGPGNNARRLLAQDDGYAIYGIDLSAEMIRMAKKQAPGGRFRVMDIRKLTPDSTYDVVIASFCIVHLTGDESVRFIQTVSRMLEPDGRLYLSFMTGKTAGAETTGFSDDPIYFNYHDPDTVIRRLSEHGIDTLELHREDYREPDGSITEDIFIFAGKRKAGKRSNT